MLFYLTTKVKQMFESGNFFYGGFALVSVRKNTVCPKRMFFVGRCDMYFTFFFISLCLRNATKIAIPSCILNLHRNLQIWGKSRFTEIIRFYENLVMCYISKPQNFNKRKRRLFNDGVSFVFRKVWFQSKTSLKQEKNSADLPVLLCCLGNNRDSILIIRQYIEIILLSCGFVNGSTCIQDLQ